MERNWWPSLVDSSFHAARGSCSFLWCWFSLLRSPYSFVAASSLGSLRSLSPFTLAPHFPLSLLHLPRLDCRCRLRRLVLAFALCSPPRLPPDEVMSGPPTPPSAPAAPMPPFPGTPALSASLTDGIPLPSPLPNMSSVCPAAKWRYESCFQNWYTADYLSGKSRDLSGCHSAFTAYRNCVVQWYQDNEPEHLVEAGGTSDKLLESEGSKGFQSKYPNAKAKKPEDQAKNEKKS